MFISILAAAVSLLRSHPSVLCISLLAIANILLCNYINFRQLAKLREKMPDAARKIFSEAEFRKSAEYNEVKLVYGIFTNMMGAFKEIVVLIVVRIIHRKCFSAMDGSDALFITGYMLADLIYETPFDAFFDFVIEKRFGFNKKTLKVFAKDFCLNFVLTGLLAFPVSKLTFWIAHRYSSFYVHIWIFLSLLQVFMVIVYPSVIAPLYNKFIPLENDSLRTRIEELAKKAGFSVGKILVMDGSKRSGHSNAYFTGFGKTKKIVFYDTILKHLNDDEILAVLCHELGHWVHSHVLYLIAAGMAQLFVYLYTFNYFIGSSSKDPISVKFIEFNTLFSCTIVPMKLLKNLLSRTFERQADRFSVRHGFGRDLQCALVKLHSENKSAPVVDAFYSAVHYSHPHTMERIEIIEKELKKVQ